jgi:nitroreductase/SAM-dependent methyltransferase
MDLDAALKDRRSIRRFKKEAVPMSSIKDVIRAACLAPSATNRQHWEFVAVTDSDIIEKLVKDAGAQRLLLNVPAVIAVLYDKTFNEQYHANIQSVSAAVQNLLLKAHETGLGACWVCGYGSEDKVKSILRVPARLGVMCFVMLGFPDESPPSPKKRPLEEVLHENSYGGRAADTPRTIRPSGWTLDEIRENQAFTSRSSNMGKDYEIYGDDEVEKISDIIKQNTLPGGPPVINVIGYDGSMLRKVSAALAKRKLIDVELSEAAIEFVKHKMKGAQYVLWDGKMPLASSSAQTVTFIFSLEKVPDMEPFLKEAKRVLKPGGKILIFAKSKWSLYGAMYYGAEKVLGIKDIESFYFRSGPFAPLRIKKVTDALEELGFSCGKKPLCFVPPEVLEYGGILGGYRKRHKKKMRLGIIVSPVIGAFSLMHRATKKRSIPFSSSVCIIAEKA